MMAAKYGFSREDLDAYAFESHKRAAAATREGRFRSEIVPITVTSTDGETIEHSVDEGIRFDASLEKIASMKTLQEGGVITAANASQICDGAAALLVVNENGLKALGAKPMARIHHMTVLGYKRRSKNVPLTGLDEVRSFRSKSVPVLMGPRERGPEDEVSGDIWEGPSGHIG
jgi:acetyl-CoA C-acetyltransferase